MPPWATRCGASSSARSTKSIFAGSAFAGQQQCFPGPCQATNEAAFRDQVLSRSCSLISTIEERTSARLHEWQILLFSTLPRSNTRVPELAPRCPLGYLLVHEKS